MYDLNFWTKQSFERISRSMYPVDSITVVSLFNHEDSAMFNVRMALLHATQRDMTDRMWKKGQYSYDYSLVTLEDFPSTLLLQFPTLFAYFHPKG